MITRKGIWPDIAILIVVAAFLAIIKPYGLYDGFGYLKGWLCWAGFMAVGRVLVGGVLHMFKGRLEAAHWIVSTVLKTLVITPVIFAIIVASFHLKQAPIPLNFWPLIFGQVFVMALAITGISTLIVKSRISANAEPQQDVLQEFMQNLPVKYRSAELYAVSAEDHYLRVHTSRGDPLILMRFKDALSQLANAKGVQTHRSWWVAVSGVRDTRRENTRLSLILKSDVTAPVSRTYTAAVKACGLNN